MPQYRIFFLDQFGRFTGAEVIDCPDDQEAIATSRQRVNGYEVELWHRDRFIIRLRHDAASSPGDRSLGQFPMGKP
jgi:hypothetical protein